MVRRRNPRCRNPGQFHLREEAWSRSNCRVVFVFVSTAMWMAPPCAASLSLWRADDRAAGGCADLSRVGGGLYVKRVLWAGVAGPGGAENRPLWWVPVCLFGAAWVDLERGLI